MAKLAIRTNEHKIIIYEKNNERSAIDYLNDEHGKLREQGCGKNWSRTTLRSLTAFTKERLHGWTSG